MPRRRKSEEQKRRERAEKDKKRAEAKATGKRRNNPDAPAALQVADEANLEVLAAERKADRAAERKRRRNDPKVRAAEQEADTAARRRRRNNPEIRAAEQEINTAARRRRRQNSPEVRVAEQEANTKGRKRRRQSPTSNKREKEMRKQRLRNPATKQHYQDANTTNKSERRQAQRRNYDKCLDNFNRKIREAPSFPCSCCGRLWYKRSTRETSEEKLQKDGYDEETISKILTISQHPHRLCDTCRNSVDNKKIPTLALSNGFDFPEIPDILKGLSPLEERLVSPRIPFMQIRDLTAGQQSSLKGNVVNVENDLDICAKVLPRKFNDTATVHVQLMRRMRYKRPYMHEAIRPYKVLQAAQYLVNTELYKSEEITLSTDWSGYTEDDTIPFDPDEDTVPMDDLDIILRDLRNLTLDNTADEVEEAGYKGTAGADETLIHYNPAEASEGLRIAPGEYKTPMALYLDLHAEELSFPTIYCGVPRKFPEGVDPSYTDIAKSEVQRYDRRACKPTKLLYSFKRSYNEKVFKSITVTMRKMVGKKKKVTAAEALNPEYLQNLLQHDEGYAVFKQLRSSPAYWQKMAKKAVAMVRQLGKCTFFLTLSAAETKWKELLVILKKIVDDETITEQQAEALPGDLRRLLIRNDPVTCMTHFDHKYKALLNELLKGKQGVFAPYILQDWMSRIEFQMRGSPHSHGLYWYDGAPEYDNDNPESEAEVVSFIDQFITCERSEDEEMKEVLAYQLHAHSPTCYKKSHRHRICRFGFPRPPLPRTMILMPLSKNCTREEKKKAVGFYRQFQDFVQDLDRSYQEKVDFTTWLDRIGLSEDDYILGIRSSLKRSTVFLKRSSTEMFVNNYNRQILLAWRANMDIQYVLDPYACAKYCVSYITKAEGGVSKLLQEATREFKRGNVSIREKLKRFASILINGSEISAQEAAAFILGIDNTSCSRQEKFVNTSHPDERVVIFKNNEILKALDPQDEEVISKGIIDHYTQRPLELEDVCLAEFATCYVFEGSGKARKTSTTARDLEADAQPESTTPTPTRKSRKLKRHPLQDGCGSVYKGLHRNILRYRHYGKEEDPENYCREQLMLFTPWRDEQTDLLDIDSIAKAQELRELITTNSEPYFKYRNIEEEELQDLMTEVRDDEYGDSENEVNEDGIEEDPVLNEAYDDDPQSNTSRVERFRIPRTVNDETYYKMMRTLNNRQRRFVLNILYLIKTGRTPFHFFLSGGAGVGKSHTINAIIQTVLRFYAKFRNYNPDQTPVLVSAPTGKAAFNVLGMTLHCCFRLPPNQTSGRIGNLNPGPLNTARVQLAGTELFLIDEVSMMPSPQVFQIDQRLRQIFDRPREAFGGRSVIVVGHFRQLPPIPKKFIFQDDETQDHGGLVGNFLWDKFRLYELTEIMRQKDDYAFCKALNNMAEGCMEEDDIALIKSRVITADNTPPEEAIWLFPSNKQCAEHNEKVHRTFQESGLLSVAKDAVQGTGSRSDKEFLRRRAKTFTPSQSQGLPYETYLQPGGEYMITTNIDVSDGLFNGATGNRRHIETRVIANEFSGTPTLVPVRVWLDFRNPIIGESKRAHAKHLYRPGIDPSWVPIEVVQKRLNLSSQTRQRGLEIIRKQFPLLAANGITIHKAQGSTLLYAVLCVRKYGRGHRISREMLYVGCSRPTTAKGLFIDGDFEPPSPPDVDDPVSLEIERLREIGFPFVLKFLQDYGDDVEKLYFHNIQSFVAHHLDLQADQSAMSSTVIALVEPHLLETDDINLPDYNIIHRSNCRQQRNSEGALILAKDADVSSYLHLDYKNDGHCLVVVCRKDDINLVFLYKSPKYPVTLFIPFVESQVKSLLGLSIVMGDINIDMKGPDAGRVRGLFRGLKMESLLDLNEPTTDGGTHIDVCFSNVPHSEAWLYESYYSYHKPICVVWPKFF